MLGKTISLTGLLVALVGAAYQLHFKRLLLIAGIGRTVEGLGNSDCHVVPELQACESTSPKHIPMNIRLTR